MRSIPFATLLVGAFLLPGARGGAEEAIDTLGRRQRGSLIQEDNQWIFRTDKAQRIVANDLAYVRFQPALDLVPKAPVRMSVLLADRQRVSGTLLGVDPKSVRFTSFWGQSFKLPRGQVVGIEPADRWLPVAAQPWQITGATRDPDRSLFGKGSLRLDAAGQQLSRTWKPALTDSRTSLYLRAAPESPTLRWTIEIVLEGKGEGDALPGLVIDNTGMRCVNLRETFGSLALTDAWHGLFIERQNDALLFYVDDSCLGRTPLTRDIMIRGIRLTTTRASKPAAEGNERGSLLIDEFSITRRLLTLPAPRGEASLDWLWLEQGEQLFGRIISADGSAVVLDAKFGKHTLAWSKLRGIGFALFEKKTASAGAEVFFRPAAGFSPDRLRGRLLRWDKTKLIVDHAHLGEIAIERDRLVKIHFEVK